MLSKPLDSAAPWCEAMSRQYCNSAGVSRTIVRVMPISCLAPTPPASGKLVLICSGFWIKMWPLHTVATGNRQWRRLGGALTWRSSERTREKSRSFRPGRKCGCKVSTLVYFGGTMKIALQPVVVILSVGVALAQPVPAHAGLITGVNALNGLGKFDGTFDY